MITQFPVTLKSGRKVRYWARKRYSVESKKYEYLYFRALVTKSNGLGVASEVSDDEWNRACAYFKQHKNAVHAN